jgi:hypothetical protein
MDENNIINAVDAKTAVSSLVSENGCGSYRLMYRQKNDIMVQTVLAYRKGGGRIHIEQFPPKKVERQNSKYTKGGRWYRRMPYRPLSHVRYINNPGFLIASTPMMNKVDTTHKHEFDDIKVGSSITTWDLGDDNKKKKFIKYIEDTVKKCFEKKHGGRGSDSVLTSAKVIAIKGTDGNWTDTESNLSSLTTNNYTELTFKVKLVFVHSEMSSASYGYPLSPYGFFGSTKVQSNDNISALSKEINAELA